MKIQEIKETIKCHATRMDQTAVPAVATTDTTGDFMEILARLQSAQTEIGTAFRLLASGLPQEIEERLSNMINLCREDVCCLYAAKVQVRTILQMSSVGQIDLKTSHDLAAKMVELENTLRGLAQELRGVYYLLGGS